MRLTGDMFPGYYAKNTRDTPNNAIKLSQEVTFGEKHHLQFPVGAFGKYGGWDPFFQGRIPSG